MSPYTVGVDFGTESGRAVLVDVGDGRELATAVYPYANGVIDEHLPAPLDHVVLGHDWALQDPQDYLRTFEHTVPAVLTEAGVDPSDVIGIGIAFTACTMLPAVTLSVYAGAVIPSAVLPSASAVRSSVICTAGFAEVEIKSCPSGVKAMARASGVRSSCVT